MHYLFAESLLNTNYRYFPIFNDSNFCDAFCYNPINPLDIYLIEHKWHWNAHNFLPHHNLLSYQNKYFEKNINVVQAFNFDSALHNTIEKTSYPDLINNQYFNCYSGFNKNKYIINSSEYNLRVEELNYSIEKVRLQLNKYSAKKNSFLQLNKHLINRKVLKGTELAKLLLKNR